MAFEEGSQELRAGQTLRGVSVVDAGVAATLSMLMRRWDGAPPAARVFNLLRFHSAG